LFAASGRCWCGGSAKLATQGHCFGADTFRTLKATYFQLALDMVRFHQFDAEINGLPFDIDVEEGAVKLFAQNIVRACDDFTFNPIETTFIPSCRASSQLCPIYPTGCAEPLK